MKTHKLTRREKEALGLKPPPLSKYELKRRPEPATNAMTEKLRGLAGG